MPIFQSKVVNLQRPLIEPYEQDKTELLTILHMLSICKVYHTVQCLKRNLRCSQNAVDQKDKETALNS